MSIQGSPFAAFLFAVIAGFAPALAASDEICSERTGSIHCSRSKSAYVNWIMTQYVKDSRVAPALSNCERAISSSVSRLALNARRSAQASSSRSFAEMAMVHYRNLSSPKASYWLCIEASLDSMTSMTHGDATISWVQRYLGDLTTSGVRSFQEKGRHFWASNSSNVDSAVQLQYCLTNTRGQRYEGVFWQAVPGDVMEGCLRAIRS